jgi:hypothetical protein
MDATSQRSGDAVAEEQLRRRRALEALIAQQQNRDKVKYDPQRMASKSAHPIWKRYEGKGAQKQAVIAAIKAREAEDELEGCTFSPAINARSKALPARRTVRACAWDPCLFHSWCAPAAPPLSFQSDSLCSR